MRKKKIATPAAITATTSGAIATIRLCETGSPPLTISISAESADGRAKYTVADALEGFARILRR